jgi:uncharacterized OsmC-like protein
MTTLTTHTVNKIDVTALQTAIDTIRMNPDAGQTRWTIHSTWMGGTRSDHEVRGFAIGGEHVERGFTIRIDEPHQLCGTNQYANPQEYLLAALNACMMVGYSAVSALMGVKLTRLQVTTTGDIDLRGFLGLDPEVAPGYEQLQQEVRIAGDATPEQFRQIHEIVKKTSPNFFNITRAVRTNSRMVVEQA